MTKIKEAKTTSRQIIFLEFINSFLINPIQFSDIQIYLIISNLE